MLTKVLLSIGFNALILFITQYFLSDLSIAGGLKTYIYFGLIFGIANGLIKPILKLLTIPVKYMTLGLSLIVINILMFIIADLTLEEIFGSNYDIVIQKNLATYLKTGIVVGAFNWLKNIILK
jgi:putative membrane protein